jgi:hypothetical protein
MVCVNSYAESLARVLYTFYLTGIEVESLIRPIDASETAHELTQLKMPALQSVALFKHHKQHSCSDLSTHAVKNSNFSSNCLKPYTVLHFCVIKTLLQRA